MSQNNLPAVKPTDLTEKDQERVARFLEQGAPGFKLEENPILTRMMDLYLGGKTYAQIARIQRVPKELVMLYSQKLDWYLIKLEYLKELELHLKGRVVTAKIASQDFLLQLSQMYQKKIGTKMDRYLQTGDETEADKINLKEIDKYLKIVESLHKISSESAPSSGKSNTPAVGINVGDGVTVSKSEDGSVEITPKQKSIGSMLETLANQRRASDAAKTVKTSDIKDVTSNQPEGKKENENK